MKNNVKCVKNWDGVCAIWSPEDGFNTKAALLLQKMSYYPSSVYTIDGINRKRDVVLADHVIEPSFFLKKRNRKGDGVI